MVGCRRRCWRDSTDGKQLESYGAKRLGGGVTLTLKIIKAQHHPEELGRRRIAKHMLLSTEPGIGSTKRCPGGMRCLVTSSRA